MPANESILQVIFHNRVLTYLIVGIALLWPPCRTCECLQSSVHHVKDCSHKLSTLCGQVQTIVREKYHLFVTWSETVPLEFSLRLNCPQRLPLFKAIRLLWLYHPSFETTFKTNERMELISPWGRHAYNKGHNNGDLSCLRYVSPGVRVSTRYINTTKVTALLSKTLICFQVHEPCSEDMRPTFQTTFKAYFPYFFKDHSSVKLQHTSKTLPFLYHGIWASPQWRPFPQDHFWKLTFHIPSADTRL